MQQLILFLKFQGSKMLLGATDKSFILSPEWQTYQLP